MRLHTKTSPFFLLLLNPLVDALVSKTAALPADAQDAVGSTLDHGDSPAVSALKITSGKGAALLDKDAIQVSDDSLPALNFKGHQGVPTKDAPVDGKDGKPHLGPFVGSESSTDSKSQNLPPLKGRPNDPTIIDGKKIPETNDGIMFDKNRDRPQEGTTGTEGGVSEKAKQKKAQESKTGEKVLTQPEGPKDHLSSPHGSSDKVALESQKEVSKQASSDKIDDSDYTGLDVRIF